MLLPLTKQIKSLLCEELVAELFPIPRTPVVDTPQCVQGHVSGAVLVSAGGAPARGRRAHAGAHQGCGLWPSGGRAALDSFSLILKVSDVCVH